MKSRQKCSGGYDSIAEAISNRPKGRGKRNVHRMEIFYNF